MHQGHGRAQPTTRRLWQRDAAGPQPWRRIPATPFGWICGNPSVVKVRRRTMGWPRRERPVPGLHPRQCRRGLPRGLHAAQLLGGCRSCRASDAERHRPQRTRSTRRTGRHPAHNGGRQRRVRRLRLPQPEHSAIGRSPHAGGQGDRRRRELPGDGRRSATPRAGPRTSATFEPPSPGFGTSGARCAERNCRSWRPIRRSCGRTCAVFPIRQRRRTGSSGQSIGGFIPMFADLFERHIGVSGRCWPRPHRAQQHVRTHARRSRSSLDRCSPVSATSIQLPRRWRSGR